MNKKQHRTVILDTKGDNERNPTTANFLPRSHRAGKGGPNRVKQYSWLEETQDVVWGSRGSSCWRARSWGVGSCTESSKFWSIYSNDSLSLWIPICTSTSGNYLRPGKTTKKEAAKQFSEFWDDEPVGRDSTMQGTHHRRFRRASL